MNNVLIIEDEQIAAKAVKDALELYNVGADIAQNGAIGLRLFEENNYDLVLLDLKMPEMDGEEVLTKIRQIDPFVDVIIYTNYSNFADIKKLTNIGIDGYINKGPEAELQTLVDTILKKLAPLDEEAVEQLIRHTPEDLFGRNEGE